MRCSYLNLTISSNTNMRERVQSQHSRCRRYKLLLIRCILGTNTPFDFRPSHIVIRELEGAPNDGLVSVPSSMWGMYKGTLVGVSHLDLINWTDRLKWMFWQLTGTTR